MESDQKSLDPVSSLCWECRDVYRPSDDTFFLLDCILDKFEGKKIGICIEVGAGSGYISKCLRKSCKIKFSLCTDITKNSCLATMDTMKNADLQIEVIRTDLFNGFCYSYMADLIVFNPPYVPSLAKEKNYEGSNTWYGGESGLETIDEFLVQAKNYMNLEATLYFICFSNSNVERLESFIQIKIISDYCVFGPKNCGSELLSVHCFKRIK